jgi:hypothetical protein
MTAAIAVPSPEEERKAFHVLMNIEDHRDFEPTANGWAHAYLAAAEFGADALYAPFAYTVDAFRQRMQAIYDSQLAGMHQPHPYDRKLFVFGDGRRYPIGPFSDAAVKDRLLQMAPFNLTDGCWLQNIVTAKPLDEVSALLFDIWADEAGNGNVEENHCNVYDALLKSVGIYLPPITSADFIEIDVLPSAWRTCVFELCVGLFPQEFFPELLGMTLLLEWETTPQMLPMVHLLEGRGMNPLFFRLHMAIDNISTGHGARAREAIERYLADRLEEGGEVALRQSWERVWRGYVTWATVGFNGTGSIERALQIQRKQINIGSQQAPKCSPDLKDYARRRMLALVERKAPKARQVHGAATVGGQSLNNLFADPPRLLDLLLADGLFDLERPRGSRFLSLLEFGGPMYHVFEEDDVAIILDWIESLTGTPHCVDAVDPDPPPGDAGTQMQALIETLAPRAAGAHTGITLTVDGAPVGLADLLDKPAVLMGALVSNGWVVPGAPGRSMFLVRIASNGGPMDGVLSDDQLEVVKSWIDAGAPRPAPGAPQPAAAAKAKRARRQPQALVDELLPGAADGSALAWRRPYIGQGGVH